MKNAIKNAILTLLPEAEVHLFSEDEVHFQAVVVAKEFEGLSLIKQHQWVMNSLKNHFNSNQLHALALKTYTPKKWKEVNHDRSNAN